MKISIRNTVLIMAAAVATSACGGLIDTKDPEYIGVLSESHGIGREIIVTPETKTVNVAQYETVRFTHTTTGKTFGWDFSTRRGGAFDLSAVAPAGAFPPGQQVIAYISEMPRSYGP